MNEAQLERLRRECRQTDGHWQNSLEHGCRALLDYLPKAVDSERRRVLDAVRAELRELSWQPDEVANTMGAIEDRLAGVR